MAKSPSSERYVVRVLPVSEGFYLLTYVGARDPKRPPRVTVAQKPGSQEVVSFLYAPDVEDRMMVPGQSVAVSCREATDLLIMTCIQALAASDDVDLRFDRLGERSDVAAVTPIGALRAARQAQEEGPPGRSGRGPQASSAGAGRPAPGGRGPGRPQGRDLDEEDDLDLAVDLEDDEEGGEGAFADGGASHFALSGHVQAVGDTEAGADGWLGSVRGRRWIEGFAAAWDESVPGLRLTYAVDVLGRGRSKTCLAGQYAGTRRQATPIVGVEFELSGAQAASHDLVVRAAFLGEGVQEASGRRVELIGPTGEEPLTGLWLDVRKVRAAPKPKAKPTPVGKSRLRVFRSQKA